MTTNPTRVVELKINGFWVDVSGWVDVGDGGAAIVITRGRENEQADTQPGTCTFSLVNDDGRFSLDLTTGAYYPYFKRWIEVRVTIKGSRRFTGYVSNVATTLDDETGLHSHSAITCTDVLGIQAMSPAARSWAGELIGALNPLYWWPMNDPAGSTTAAAAAGGRPMTITRYAGSTAKTKDAGELVAFGVEGAAVLEADTQATVKTMDSGTALQNGSFTVTIPSAIPTPFTILLTLTADQLPKDGAILDFTGSNLRLTWARGTMTLTEGSEIDTAPSSNVIVPGKAELIVIRVRSNLITVSQPYAVADEVGVIYALSVFRPVADAPISGQLVLGGQTHEDGDFTYSNVAIIGRELSTTEINGLRTKLLGDGAAPISYWLGRALDVAGHSGAPSLTYDRQMQRPPLKGSNPAEIGNTLAKSCGGVYLAARDGTPTWLDPTYCPARVEIPFEHIDPDVSREPDESLSYTDVTVDGAVMASSGGWPKGERDVPGLLPDSSLTKYATWLANTADVWARGRFSQLPIDLLPLDSATTDAYLALDVRSRILPTGVPPQFPADMVYTVEGSSETVTKDTWQITLNTAPDPRFVLGESLLGSDYRLGWE